MTQPLALGPDFTALEDQTSFVSRRVAATAFTIIFDYVLVDRFEYILSMRLGVAKATTRCKSSQRPSTEKKSPNLLSRKTLHLPIIVYSVAFRNFSSTISRHNTGIRRRIRHSLDRDQLPVRFLCFTGVQRHLAHWGLAHLFRFQVIFSIYIQIQSVPLFCGRYLL